MAINKVKIENFTVFKDITIDFCSGVNVLIGENGTGKTHLLKMLYAIPIGGKYSTTPEWTNLRDPKGIATTFFGLKNPNELQCDPRERSIFKTTNSDNSSITFEIFKLNEKWTDEGFKTVAVKENTNSVFIPAKDMLTHSKGLLEMGSKYSKDMPFDKTLLDIIEKSKQWKLDEIPELARNIIPKLENVIGGEIIVENDTFYVKKVAGRKIDFSIEAEGFKKFGLLWQLLMNESITKDTALFWDEPEANINPKLIPDIVEILLELERNGVQIFISTHDYVLAKYLEIKRTAQNKMRFHSLYKTEEGIKIESRNTFKDLNNNTIAEAYNKLLDEVFETETKE